MTAVIEMTDDMAELFRETIRTNAEINKRQIAVNEKLSESNETVAQALSGVEKQLALNTKSTNGTKTKIIMALLGAVLFLAAPMAFIKLAEAGVFP